MSYVVVATGVAAFRSVGMAWGSGGSRQCISEDLLPRLRSNDPSLTAVFVLPFRLLSPSGAIEIANALGENTHLAEFVASGHPINADASAAFGRALVSTMLGGIFVRN